jgi:putative transposase
MGRSRRAADGGYVYHVLNRANARLTIFEDDAEYEAWERVLLQAVERTKTRLLAYCVMRTPIQGPGTCVSEWTIRGNLS